MILLRHSVLGHKSMTSWAQISFEWLVLQQTMLDDLISVSLQFIHIPIGRHESTPEEISLHTGEVDGETAKQFG